MYQHIEAKQYSAQDDAEESLSVSGLGKGCH